MIKKQEVIVFDFDGTLSASDANKEFLKYCMRHSLRPWLFLPVIGFGAFLSLFDRKNTNLAGRRLPILWREIMRCFITEKLVADLAPGFVKEHITRRFDWAKAKVAAEHYSKEVRVLLISAGPDYLIPELVKDMKFDAVICSSMQKHKPWKFSFLCWGMGKVAALDKWAKENKVLPVVVRSYGDSYGDTPIMSLAKEQVWVG